MFDVQEYLNELKVKQDDEEFQAIKEAADLVTYICDDAWLARARFFGEAGAMERHIEYLGSNMIPNQQAKLTRLEAQGGNGILSESYTVDSWFGTTNADDPHMNDEVGKQQQIDDTKTFIEQLEKRQRTAALMLAVAVREHDELSGMLDQHKYGTIKAMAEAKRKAA